MLSKQSGSGEKEPQDQPERGVWGVFLLLRSSSFLPKQEVEQHRACMMGSATSDVGLRAGTQYQIQDQARFRGGLDQDGRRPAGPKASSNCIRRSGSCVGPPSGSVFQGHDNVTAATNEIIQSR